MANKTKQTKATTKSKVAKSKVNTTNPKVTKSKGKASDVLKSKKEPIEKTVVDESLKSKKEPTKEPLVSGNVVEDNLSTNVVESKKEKAPKVKSTVQKDVKTMRNTHILRNLLS